MCWCVVVHIGYGFVFEVQGLRLRVQGLGCCSSSCCGSHLRFVVWTCVGVVSVCFIVL